MAIVKVQTLRGESVEVDTDDIMTKLETNDIISELHDRSLNEGDLEYLKDIWGGDEPDITVSTLDDQMKRDYILEIFDKYSLSEMESKLPK